MRYRLEWNQGSFESNDMEAIINHPYFNIGTVFERISFGWLAA